MADLSTIMTLHPQTVTRATTLDEALDLMDRLHVRHLPVVDAGRLGGIVSDRDLLEATGWLPARVHAASGSRPIDELPRTIGEIVHDEVTSASPGESVESAAATLLRLKIGCLPIEEGGVLEGIVTDTDLLKFLMAARRESPGAISGGTSVQDQMTPSPGTIGSGATVGEARALLLAADMRHIPVVDDGRLVGIVSDRDLRRAHGQGMRDTTPVDRIMSRSLATVSRDTSLEGATELILEHRISALPVVEGDAELVGVLTIEDLLDGFLDGAEGAEDRGSA